MLSEVRFLSGRFRANISLYASLQFKSSFLHKSPPTASFPSPQCLSLSWRRLQKSFNTLLQEGSDSYHPIHVKQGGDASSRRTLHKESHELISCLWESQKMTHILLYLSFSSLCLLLPFFLFLLFWPHSEFNGVMLPSPVADKAAKNTLWAWWVLRVKKSVSAKGAEDRTSEQLHCSGRQSMKTQYHEWNMDEDGDVHRFGAASLIRCQHQTTRSCHKAVTHWFSEIGVSGCISAKTKSRRSSCAPGSCWLRSQVIQHSCCLILALQTT